MNKIKKIFKESTTMMVLVLVVSGASITFAIHAMSNWINTSNFLSDAVTHNRALKPNEISDIKTNLDYLYNHKADKPITCTGSNKALTWSGSAWGCNTIASAPAPTPRLNLPVKSAISKVSYIDNWDGNSHDYEYQVQAKVVNDVRLIRILKPVCNGPGCDNTHNHPSSYTACTNWESNSTTCTASNTVSGKEISYSASFNGDRVVKCQYGPTSYGYYKKTCITW